MRPVRHNPNLRKPPAVLPVLRMPPIVVTPLDRRVLVVHFVEELGDARLIEQVHCADRAITLFGDDDFCFAAFVAFGVVVFVAIDKHDDVGVLFDAA